MYDSGYQLKTLDGLIARGHVIKKWPYRFNSIQALWVSRASNSQGKFLFGASDPSKLGRPAVVKDHIQMEIERGDSQKSVE